MGALNTKQSDDSLLDRIMGKDKGEDINKDIDDVAEQSTSSDGSNVITKTKTKTKAKTKEDNSGLTEKLQPTVSSVMGTDSAKLMQIKKLMENNSFPNQCKTFLEKILTNEIESSVETVLEEERSGVEAFSNIDDNSFLFVLIGIILIYRFMEK